MNRLLVALLAAFDAVMAVAVGIAAALAPLTLLWVFGFDGDAAWSALWPTAVKVWQAGHLVPLQVELPSQYAAVTGIPDGATAFAFSLAPLAFALFTAVFAARSGARAARAGAWVVGVTAAGLVVAVLSWLAAATSAVPLAAATMWQAVLFPALVFALPALGGALVQAWRDGDGGPLDRLRAWMDIDGYGIVEAAARGTAAVAAGFVGVGAAAFALSVALGAGEIVSLFEAAHVDLAGATVVALGQLLYLPTLIVWGASYAAGPGFALGTGTAVSPAGTQLGVIPGVPVLGVVPENPSPWLLLLALLVVAVGALAGWIARARLHGEAGDAPTLTVRAVVLGIIALAAAGTAALLALAASGAIGPDRLQHVGPDAGMLALIVGIEVAVGAAAVLLSPVGDVASRPAEHAEIPPVD